jgi:hypothetical protein
LHEESTDNGLRLNQLPNALNMVRGRITNPHKKIYLVTWRSPDGITNDQSDRILTDARYKNNMMVVRMYSKVKKAIPVTGHGGL